MEISYSGKIIVCKINYLNKLHGHTCFFFPASLFQPLVGDLRRGPQVDDEVEREANV